MNTLFYGYCLGYIPALTVCARFNESGQLGFMWVLCGPIFPFFAVGCHLGHTQTSSVKAVGVLTDILALPLCAVLPKIPGRLAAMIYSTGLSSLAIWHWAMGLGSLNCGGGMLEVMLEEPCCTMPYSTALPKSRCRKIHCWHVVTGLLRCEARASGLVRHPCSTRCVPSQTVAQQVDSTGS